MISIGFSFLSVTNEMVADIEVINNTKHIQAFIPCIGGYGYSGICGADFRSEEPESSDGRDGVPTAGS